MSDSKGLFLDVAFAIRVEDVNERPTRIKVLYLSSDISSFLDSFTCPIRTWTRTVPTGWQLAGWQH